MKKRKTKLIVLFLAAMIACVGTGCTDNTAKTENSSASVTSSAAASEDESKSEVPEESNTQSKTESSAESADETPASDSIDYMALVNKTHPLPEDWENKLETVHITNSVGDDVEVEKKAYDAYLRLKEELEKEDIHVDLDSARRSVADQQRIMDDFTEQYGKDYALKTVAAPGYSEHHTGLALDLYLIIDGKDVVENEDMIQYPEIWSKIHAKLADHGFILRYLEDKEHITGYGYEPWHIRYLDNTDTAKEIMSKGITLEGYLGTASEADVSIDLGNSEIYTQDELKDAVIQIKCKFASLASCELKSIRYAGDEAANDENLKRMTYADGYYKPMISLVKYLTENGFKVYINSGSEVNMLRELSQDVLGEYVPPLSDHRHKIWHYCNRSGRNQSP